MFAIVELESITSMIRYCNKITTKTPNILQIYLPNLGGE